MSRRIAFFVLAAIVSLVATQAFADSKLGPAGAALAYRHGHYDPAWKRCQIGERDFGHHHFYCGPYSYHPYGFYGHRPYGTFTHHRSPPVYGLAPNAKIISVDPMSARTTVR
jgi:hypothetical protein